VKAVWGLSPAKNPLVTFATPEKYSILFLRDEGYAILPNKKDTFRFRW